jgi:hypothetical protein
MSKSPDRAWFPSYRCKDCGSETGYRSRRRTWVERLILPLLLLQPVRCGECFRRDYRMIFIRVRARVMVAPMIAPRKPSATSTGHVA